MEKKIKQNGKNARKLKKALSPNKKEEEDDDDGENKGDEETAKFESKAKNTKKMEKRKSAKYRPSSNTKI